MKKKPALEISRAFDFLNDFPHVQEGQKAGIIRDWEKMERGKGNMENGGIRNTSNLLTNLWGMGRNRESVF